MQEYSGEVIALDKPGQTLKPYEGDVVPIEGGDAGRGRVSPRLVNQVRRGTERSIYVAPDNPANPILPTGGSVLENVRMPAPSFDEERRGRRDGTNESVHVDALA